MVEINYCPSCGAKLKKGSFICPNCKLDIEEFFAKGYLLQSNHENNTIELFDREMMDVDIMDNKKVNVNSGDEIVIVVPENADEDELVIDLDELGIDVENLGDDVNIVIQVEGEDIDDDIFEEEDDASMEPNEWYFDDDPYSLVYYEFPDYDDEE